MDCLSASIHENDIAYNRLGFLARPFVMSSNNCEISVTLSMDYLTIPRDDGTDSSQNPLRHSRHSGVPVSNGQA